MDILDVLPRHPDRKLAELDGLDSSVAGLVLDDLENGLRRCAVPRHDGKQRVEHLLLAGVVALPTRRRVLAHGSIDFERELRLPSSSGGHWKVVAGMLARLLKSTMAPGLPLSTAGCRLPAFFCAMRFTSSSAFFRKAS